jgi:hypothetical protein
LGTDYALAPTSERKDQYDWEIDTAHGSVDFKKVSGVDNLAQGLTTRLTTTKGHNVLYKKLGLRQAIGFNQVDIDAQMGRFFVVTAITEDPRVASVNRLKFTDEGPDVFGLDAYVQPRGFSQGVSVNAIGVAS